MKPPPPTPGWPLDRTPCGMFFRDIFLCGEYQSEVLPFFFHTTPFPLPMSPSGLKRLIPFPNCFLILFCLLFFGEPQHSPPGLFSGAWNPPLFSFFFFFLSCVFLPYYCPPLITERLLFFRHPRSSFPSFQSTFNFPARFFLTYTSPPPPLPPLKRPVLGAARIPPLTPPLFC